MNFDDAFTRLVDPEHEGGYVNDPNDPGGATKYGLSQRAYPGEDIANMTLDRAKTIYLRDYWGPAGCDALPDLLKYEMFDLAVNTGRVTAIRLLQQAMGATVDGILGPKTLLAAQTADPVTSLRKLQALRIRYYIALADSIWQHFGRGWMDRVATNMMEA